MKLADMVESNTDSPILSIPSGRATGYPGAMFYAYDLRLDGFTVYTGVTEDPGLSLVRHLAAGNRFDAFHILARCEELEQAKRAAQDRQYLLDPLAHSRRPVPQVS